MKRRWREAEKADALARANARLRIDLRGLYGQLDAHHAKTLAAPDTPKVSCTKGCSACCRQIVLAELSEADLIVATHPDVVARALPKLLAHHADIRKMSVDSVWNMYASKAAEKQGAREYWALNIPCAFLEDGLCSIYDVRPIACRTHFVISPPSQCEGTESGASDVAFLDMGSRTSAQEYWANVVAVARKGELLPGALPQLVLKAWQDSGRALPAGEASAREREMD